ncbi:unnamed protein product [marine sediment metagenome]|uniref:Uncharacterized protein n=1 Tax=marine sediment metagenome TaxID=412755 RepID=X1APN3_9ZZZZ
MQLARIINKKKFMWDKGIYSTEAEAKVKIKKYEREGFETHLIEDERKYFIYSRRIVTEIVLEGDAPPG